MHRHYVSMCAGVLMVIGLAITDAGAATVTASSCSSSDVQAAINRAANGDTVVVPAGSCAWTTTVSMNKAVSLSGGGAVTITNNVPNGAPLLAITESSAGYARLNGFTFPTGTGTGKRLWVQATAGGRPVLVNKNTWSGPSEAILWQSNRGVIWDNTFEAGGTTLAWPHQFQQSLANDVTSWSTPSTMGTADVNGESNVYFEGNRGIGFFQQFMDLDNAARAVVRYNTFRNTALSSHGWESSAVGVRHYEFYNNTFTIDTSGDYCSGSGLNFQHWLHFRGGTGIVTQNTLPNIIGLCPGYGDVPEIALEIHNLRRRWGSGPGSAEINNPCWSTLTPGGYPVPRQVGQSHDGIRYITDPIYIWNNPGLPSGNPFPRDYPNNECGTSAPAISSYVIEGRDYVLGAKPGYTPYPYPHPLAAGSSTSGSSASPPPPPPASTVPPPSNLTVR